MHSELKALAPHRVEGVAVDGFGAEMVGVDRHSQDIYLDAGAAGAVTRTDVLSRNKLRGKDEMLSFLSKYIIRH